MMKVKKSGLQKGKQCDTTTKNAVGGLTLRNPKDLLSIASEATEYINKLDI